MFRVYAKSYVPGHGVIPLYSYVCGENTLRDTGMEFGSTIDPNEETVNTPHLDDAARRVYTLERDLITMFDMKLTENIPEVILEEQQPDGSWSEINYVKFLEQLSGAAKEI